MKRLTFALIILTAFSGQAQLKSAQAVVAQFLTLRGDGALADADALPTGTVVVNGVDNGAAVTVANVTTGEYKATVTLPALTAGDIVQLRANYAIDGITTARIVPFQVGDTSRTSDIATTLGAAGAGLTGLPAVTLAASQHVIVDSGTVTTVTNPVTAGTVSDKTGYSLTTAPLTAQQARDAMKLAPSSGAPAIGSIDKHLDDQLSDTELVPFYVWGYTDGSGRTLTTSPPTASTIAGAVLDEAKGAHTGWLASLNNATQLIQRSEPPTAATIAAEILVTPANKLATGAAGVVTVGTNNDKTGYALTTQDWVKVSDLSGLATSANVTSAVSTLSSAITGVPAATLAVVLTGSTTVSDVFVGLVKWLSTGDLSGDTL